MSLAYPCPGAATKSLFDRILAMIEGYSLVIQPDLGPQHFATANLFVCRTLHISPNVCYNLGHVRAINPLFSVGARGDPKTKTLIS